MIDRYDTLASKIDARFGEQVNRVASTCRELTYELDKDDLIKVATALRNEADFGFEMLIDVCGVDYLNYGSDEWTTNSASGTGFSRGVEREPVILDEADEFDPRRFAVVYHLLSLQNNVRLRLRIFTGTANPPIVKSVVDIWNSANWFEREAFDLYGIFFEGHPDLRRILTDYGFIGHPFRKDFPVMGNVEVSYDADEGRVVYKPVSIEPRTLVDNCGFSAAVGFCSKAQCAVNGESFTSAVTQRRNPTAAPIGLACQRPWTSLQLLPRATAITSELRLAMNTDKLTEPAIITLQEHSDG